MKLWIESADAGQGIDGSLSKHILSYLPVGLGMDHDAILVPISWFPNYVFNKNLLSIKQPWILIDFLEPHAPSEEYDKFDKWKLENPPRLSLVRELKQADASATMLPIEWSCYLPIPGRATKENFMARPLELLYFWGYSNAMRPKLHGEIFSEGMAKHGLNVVSEWSMDDGSTSYLRAGNHWWASIFTPHWKRKPMSEILLIMQQSKITVSMPGNGHKTFRDTECVGTLMAIQKSDIAYAYPWDETNSIQLTPGNEFQSLLEATRRTDLYELYCACDEQMRKYEAKTYVNNYVLPAIQSVL